MKIKSTSVDFDKVLVFLNFTYFCTPSVCPNEVCKSGSNIQNTPLRSLNHLRRRKLREVRVTPLPPDSVADPLNIETDPDPARE